MRQHLDVVLVDLRELADLSRILAVMRHAVEAGGRCRAFRVRPAGEVAREEQRADARDVGLERQREQVELQLDVLVEGLRHAHRHRHVFRRDGRGLHRNLQATLDLADVGRVVVEPLAVGGADVACACARGCRSASRGCCCPACGGRPAARPCCRRRTSARTPPADSAPSAAARSATPTRWCWCRCSCSPRRSCSSWRRGLRRPAAATASANPRRSSAR